MVVSKVPTVCMYVCIIILMTFCYVLVIPDYLPYLDLSNTGVESIQLPALDDGISEQIDIVDGLPFGTNHPIAVWVWKLL